MPNQGFQGCPILGVGLGLRSDIYQETIDSRDVIDWVEIVSENYLNKGGQAMATLKDAMRIFPVVPHGVSMSIGGVDPLNQEHLSQLQKLFEIINPPWFSDHLCFGSAHGNYFNDLMPMLRTREAVDHVISRIKFIQDTFQRPFLIENISYYFELGANELSEADFVSEILEKSDCGMLLDVNNIYVNAVNHQQDSMAFLKNIPLNRVVQIHVAGHNHFPQGIVDTHGNAVCDEVWALLEWVMQNTKPCAVMIERDQSFPPFEELRQEVIQLRKLWEATQAPISKLEAIS